MVSGQVDGIKDMQRFLLEKRIAEKALAVLIQAPLLICIFIVFGYLVGDMANIGLF